MSKKYNIRLDLAEDSISLTATNKRKVEYTLLTLTPRESYDLMDELAEAAERVLDHRERLET